MEKKCQAIRKVGELGSSKVLRLTQQLDAVGLELGDMANIYVADDKIIIERCD